MIWRATLWTGIKRTTKVVPKSGICLKSITHCRMIDNVFHHMFLTEKFLTIITLTWVHIITTSVVAFWSFWHSIITYSKMFIKLIRLFTKTNTDYSLCITRRWIDEVQQLLAHNMDSTLPHLAMGVFRLIEIWNHKSCIRTYKPVTSMHHYAERPITDSQFQPIPLTEIEFLWLKVDPRGSSQEKIPKTLRGNSSITNMWDFLPSCW